MVVNPQIARKHDRQGREADTSGDSNEIVEDRNRFSKNERDTAQTEHKAKPSAPVHHRVRLQVSTIPQDSDEDILRRDVEIETAAHRQSDETNCVRSDLQITPCGAEGGRCDVLATPAVDDQGEAEV